MMIYNIYIDGSCKGNPGPGGWAVMVYTQHGEQIAQQSGRSFGTTTNIEMELAAFYWALYYQSKAHVDCTINIYTDSQYVDLGFKNKVSQGSHHIALWALCNKLLEETKNTICVHKVKAHSGNIYNDAVDELAKSPMP